MFVTIRGKLIALSAVLIAGFILVGFMTAKTDNDAKRVAERLVLAGEIRTDLAQVLLEIRGYQLNALPERLAGYEAAFKRMDGRIKTLHGMVRNPQLRGELMGLSAELGRWHEENLPRIEMISRYKTEIHSDAFKESADGKRLAMLNRQSAEGYGRMDVHLGALTNSISELNFKALEENSNLVKLTIGILIVSLLGVSFMIIRSVSQSIEMARSGCERLIQTRDLRQPIATGGRDEVSQVMEHMNRLIRELSTVLSKAKRAASENASVAEELSRTSMQIGRRSEETARSIEETREATGKIARILEYSEGGPATLPRTKKSRLT